MSTFDRAVVSIPGRQRFGQTPFGAPMVVHATAAETGGSLGAWDTLAPPGRGPAGHTHTREIELFLVIEGTYHFTCGGDEFDAPAGTVVVLPPHVPHKWWNIGSGPGCTMAVVTPGGFEQMFIDYRGMDGASEDELLAVEAALGVSDSPAPVAATE